MITGSQDWYHESCLNLRERPMLQDTDRTLTHHPHLHKQPGEHPPHTAASGEPTVMEGDTDDGMSETSSSGLPPPLITSDQYEALVCRSCVLKIPVLQKYAGTPDALAIVRRSTEDPLWRVIGRASDMDANVKIDIEAGEKRSRATSEDDGPASKRMRLDGDNEISSSSVSPCLAPIPSEEIQSLLGRMEEGDYELFAGDLFLTDDFRDRWCKCSSVRPTNQMSA